MITVAGEALIDIVVGPSGLVTALPGGAPFNVARTIARLGGECQFLGQLSEDAFGEQLRASLARDGVRIAVARVTSAPTTLAIAQLDEFGIADYRFYVEGTAAAQLVPADVPADILEGSGAFALGGLALLIEPTASTLDAVIARKPPRITTLLDPNCRPRAVNDLPAYRDTIARFTRQVDVVKVSVDDLRMLRPRAGISDGVRGLLELGPAAVLVTDGAAPVSIHTASALRSVPVPEVSVVDTVGAGDAFVAAFLTAWSDNALGREDLVNADMLAQITATAVEVAAAACTVQGANLPADFRWSTTAGSPERIAHS